MQTQGKALGAHHHRTLTRHALLTPTRRHHTPIHQPHATAVADVGQAAPSQPQPKLLSKLVQAHGTTITALCILSDQGSEKLIVSSSLDKTLCTWRLATCKQPLPPGTVPSPEAPPPLPILDALGNPKLEVQVVRLKAPRAPVFSIVAQPQPQPNGSVFSPNAKVLFCGNAAKELFAWEVRPCQLDDPCPANFQMVATEYSGWVRSLAIMGKWLISCGCNCLRQHDTSFPLPKEVSNIEQAFKGDILTIAASNNKVFAGCADGCLRSWTVNAKNGALTLGKEAPLAHNSRITGLTLEGPHLYSVSLDGSIRVWRTQDLVCVAEVQAGHEGKKIHAIVTGPDRLLYTGGDDKLIRRWQPLSAHPDFIRDKQPLPAVPISPSVQVDATTGEMTSTFSSESDSDDDSLDCDLGGPPSMQDGNTDSIAQSSAAALSPSDSSTQQQADTNGSSSSSSSSSEAAMNHGDVSTADGGLTKQEASTEAGPDSSKEGASSSSGSSSTEVDEKGSRLDVIVLQSAGPPLGSHSSGLRCLAASASGDALVSGDSDGDLCIWGLPLSS